MEIDSNIVSALVGAVIGGLIGWLSSYFIARLTHNHEIQRNELEEKSLVNGFLQAYKTELQVNWNLYTDRYGKIVEELKEDGSLPFFPVDGNYLIVYERNTHLIGKVTDSELRSLIVKTYAEIMGLIDSIRFLNSLITRYNEMEGKTTSAVVQQQKLADALRIRRQQITTYSQGVKRLHVQLKPVISNLMNKLSEHLRLNEASKPLIIKKKSSR
jgi:hypothetical protein